VLELVSTRIDPSEPMQLALLSPKCGFSHAMRNELVEELIIEGEAKAMQNRTGSPSKAAKPARGRAKQAAERKK
jgi:hypothetical protein